MRVFLRPGSMLALVVCLYSPMCLSSPWGIDYFVLFDGLVVDSDLEGHIGFVPFDGLTDIVPNDLVPPPPGVPGNNLLVAEDVTTTPGADETISIWIQSDGANCPEIFCNDLELLYLVVDSLYWSEGRAARVGDITLLVTFSPSDPGTPITPLAQEFYGAGTFEDPLGLSFDLDPGDFAGATGLHLHFTTVSLVPLPATLSVFAWALLALPAMSRRGKVA